MNVLRFQPLFKERVWGGRRLAELYGKRLPTDVPIGESWEIVDRPEEQSVVLDGPLAGSTLGGLWRSERRIELFGARAANWGERFPLLVKLLDAEHALSVQVHPPASLAPEPKTEMWFIAEARTDAHLLAGLRAGVDRARFESALRNGADIAGLLHRIGVSAGDSLFVPSGRVHAIGPGNLVVEVQQNSDTTYRVSDFARVGLDGRPRELHVEESLASIDFDDVEPSLQNPLGDTIVSCDFFHVERLELDRASAAASAAPALRDSRSEAASGAPAMRDNHSEAAAPPGEMAILASLRGKVRCGECELAPGQFALVPATESGSALRGEGELLRVTLPR
ncbi:MAG: type I phosphomannose isomerase catalytic subunit [Solirubrobacteraceae bacterium]